LFNLIYPIDKKELHQEAIVDYINKEDKKANTKVLSEATLERILEHISRETDRVINPCHQTPVRCLKL
jgi:hypothetical protein